MLGLFKGKGRKKGASKESDESDDDMPFARDDGPDEMPAGFEDGPAGAKGKGGKKPSFLGSLLGRGKKAPGKGQKGKGKGKGKPEANAPDPFDNPAVLALIAAEVSSLPPPEDVPEDEAAAPVVEPDIDGARHARPMQALPGDTPPADDIPFDDDDMPLGLDDMDDEDDDKKGKRSTVVVGAVAATVVLAALGGGAWWWLTGTPDGAGGDIAGLADEDPAANTPQSGRSIAMSMPTTARPLQAPPEADGRSLSRRPWLNDAADAPPAGGEDKTPAADDPAVAGKPAPEDVAATPPEAPAPEPVAPLAETPVSVPPEQRLALVAPKDDLPPLKEPLFPAEPADQHVVPAFDRLPPPKAPPVALAPAPVAAVARTTPQGVIPVVGPKGETAWQTYARPFTAPADTPRIALIVTGLGLDPEATEAAIVRLPAEVSLSFSPYAPRLADQVTRARAHGHEVLLDLPLEGEAFPSHDPGPLGMISLLPQTENTTRLEQIMSRAVGYTGFVGAPGAKFGGSRVHMRTVLEPLAQRGLLYVHTAPESGLAGSADLDGPRLHAVSDIDARPFREAIDARLSWLEEVAKVRGTTVAVASPLPVTFERLTRWIGELPRKGVVLAPASAVMPRPST